MAMLRLALSTLLAALLPGACAVNPVPSDLWPSEPVGRFWYDEGAAWLQGRKQHLESGQATAKSVVIFVGNGLDPTTNTASRLYKGQLTGIGELNGEHSWDKFEDSGSSMTYSLDYQTGDAASTITSILSGSKTKMGRINWDESTPNCGSEAQYLQTLAEKYGKGNGAVELPGSKAIGLVTNARLTEATAAGMYAHTPDRQAEGNRNEDDPGFNCDDIATQLTRSHAWNVALGGGRQMFTPVVEGGLREDGDNIATRWAKGAGYHWVNTAEELAAIDVPAGHVLLGTFADSHMSWANEREATEPTLMEMAEKAISILSNKDHHPDGFILLVEGGLIGKAHQQGKYGLALSETLDMDRVVARVKELIDPAETLLLVTGNHGYTNYLNGYPDVGNGMTDTLHYPAEDGMDYTTLGYANGPGGGKRVTDPITASTDTTDPHYICEANVKFNESGTSGGQDTGVWATGPGSELVEGTHEQNYLFFVMDDALGGSGRRLASQLPLVSDLEDVGAQQATLTSVASRAVAEAHLVAAKERAAFINTTRAQSAILFVGDGMDIMTVTASRFYKGQQAGNNGAGTRMHWEENMADFGFAKTSNTDGQVSDSAGTAAAMVSGIKTRKGVVGVNDDARRAVCHNPEDHESTLAEWAKRKGMGVGFVSTARITHATPSAMYAHSADRNWEAWNDDDGARGDCPHIAKQLLDWNVAGVTWDVAMGGGREKFLDSEISDWQLRTGGTYVVNKTQLDAATTLPILGLFEESHMTYHLDRPGETDEPTLTNMVDRAISILSDTDRFPNGYVLLAEAGRIDHGHHDGKWQKAMRDTVEFESCIKHAYENTEDTLIIVTADHGHTTSMAGPSAHGTNILDVVKDAAGTPAIADDDKTYTTLGYANGGGAHEGARRRADTVIDEADTRGIDYQQESYIYFGSETHGGQDVGVWAAGPKSHLFGGVFHQHAIYHVMMEALEMFSRPDAFPVPTPAPPPTPAPTAEPTPAPTPAPPAAGNLGTVAVVIIVLLALGGGGVAFFGTGSGAAVDAATELAPPQEGDA